MPSCFPVRGAVNPQTLGPSYVRTVDQAVAPARAVGVRVSYGGQLSAAAQPKSGDARSELIGIAAALVVLLVGFGSVYAAGLPVGSALAGAFAGLGLLGMLAAATTFATVSPTLAIMIGLGVGIDYALFLTTRHRQLVMDGADPADAAGRVLATSGHAVIIAAGTAVIALLSLYASGITFLGKLGLAGGLTVAVAALGALTGVPAPLGLAGRNIDRLRVRRRPTAEAQADHTGWDKYAERIGSHPRRYLSAGTAVLAMLAIPFLSLQLGHVDTLQDQVLTVTLAKVGTAGSVTGSLAGQLQFRDQVGGRLPVIIAVVIAAGSTPRSVGCHRPARRLLYAPWCGRDGRTGRSSTRSWWPARTGSSPR